jgi:tetratricopeptide (TPR) repeat protein
MRIRLYIGLLVLAMLAGSVWFVLARWRDNRDRTRWQAHMNAAFMECERQRYDRAEAELLEALKISEGYDPGKPILAENLFMPGEVRQHQGDFVRAEALYSKGLAIFRKAYKEPNESGLIGPLTMLVEFYRAKGDYDKAEEFYVELLNVVERVFGRESSLLKSFRERHEAWARKYLQSTTRPDSSTGKNGS